MLCRPLRRWQHGQVHNGLRHGADHGNLRRHNGLDAVFAADRNHLGPYIPGIRVGIYILLSQSILLSAELGIGAAVYRRGAPASLTDRRYDAITTRTPISVRVPMANTTGCLKDGT